MTSTPPEPKDAAAEAETWLEASWFGAAEARKLDPDIDLDEHRTRIEVNSRDDRGEILVYAVALWHVGDETALHSDDYIAGDKLGVWRGIGPETLDGLPPEIRRGHRAITVNTPAAAADPEVKFGGTEPNDRFYYRPKAAAADAGGDADAETEYTLDDDELRDDYHAALKMDPGAVIPEGCDMSAALAAGRNHVALYTERGNPIGLYALDGTRVFEEDRPW